MIIKTKTAALGIAVLIALSAGIAKAGDEYVLTIKNHTFSPATLEIPAGQKVKIVIDNQDSTPAEFESYELGREKIISGGSKGIVFVGPLKPGAYPFFEEFHMDSARGQIIAK